MAPRKRPPTEDEAATTQAAVIVTTPQVSPLTSTAKLPTILRFPLVVILTLSINALTNTIAADILGPSLAPVSRTLNEGWQAAAVVTWKALELGVAWFMGFDGTLHCLYQLRLDRSPCSSHLLQKGHSTACTPSVKARQLTPTATFRP